MPDVYGFDAAGIRKIEEVVRRVLQTSFGKGGKRQRWPVGGGGAGARIIRFRFDEFTSGSVTVGLCTVLSSSSGALVGEQVDVTDATAEGCFFTDETEAELVGRNGFAVWMKSHGRWEVFSLCCPPEGS